MTITLENSRKQTYILTDDNPWLPGQATLVAPDGDIYGPRDRIQSPDGDWMDAGDYLSSCLFLVDPADQDCAVIKAFFRQ